MVKHSIFIALLTLVFSGAQACYDPAGSGQCGPSGIGPRNPSGYGNSVNSGGGGYYDPSRIPLPPIVITLPDRFGAIAQSPKLGKIYIATNKNSEANARQIAMKLCRSESGELSCKLIFFYKKMVILLSRME